MANFHWVLNDDVRLRVAIEGDHGAPLVILVHGFPESWYSWRHQIKALAEAGYRVAAPDVRGYGGSDRPHEVSAYTIEALTADIAAIARTLAPEAPAVVIGHDWGAPIAWNSALLFPKHFRAVAGLSVPYIPLGPVPPLELYRKVFTENGLFFYQIYFQEEGRPEAELEADPSATIRKFYYSISGDAPDGTWPSDKPHGEGLLDRLPEPPTPLPWLDDNDVRYYDSQFRASGFRGPLNRYRAQPADHAYLTALPDNIIHQPALFIGGTRDPVISMFQGDIMEMMRPYLPNLTAARVLEGCGHWTQQERPDEVNALLIEWLGCL
ncbi:MAG: alpha/beta hydrolase [Pseudomonadota bacterium]